MKATQALSLPKLRESWLDDGLSSPVGRASSGLSEDHLNGVFQLIPVEAFDGSPEPSGSDQARCLFATHNDAHRTLKL